MRSFLFLLYINDINKILKQTYCLLFADDANLFPQHKQSSKLFGSINHDLELLTNWLEMNKIILELEDKYYMICKSLSGEVYYLFGCHYYQHCTIYYE